MSEELKNDFKCFRRKVAENKRTLIVGIATIICIAIFQDVVKRELLRIDSIAYWFAVETLRNTWSDSKKKIFASTFVEKA